LRTGKLVTRVTRTLRLVRFLKLNKAFATILTAVSSEYVLAGLNLVRLLTILTIFAHYIACGWYGLSMLSETTWSSDKEAGMFESMTYAYFTSLHWSITQFTPASMEIVPRNVYERVYNVIVILIAMVTFSSFVSSITNTMTHIRNINAQKGKEEASIRKFFNQYNISSELASRVWFVLQRNRMLMDCRLKVSDVPALQCLPVTLLDDIRAEAYSPQVALHPIFHVYAAVDTECMRNVCCGAVAERTVAVGEELYGKGVVVTSMLIVMQGTIEYQDAFADVDDDIPRLYEGDWACELALWAVEASVSGPFVADRQRVDLLTLEGTRLRVAAQKHPESLKLLCKYAEDFMVHFNEACMDQYFTNPLFNEKRMIEGLANKAQKIYRLSTTFAGV